MFAVNPQPSWINFQPQIPSPLSPRSLNACYDTGHSLSIPMSFPRKSPPKTDPSKHPSRYNVLSHGNKDAERDKRRDLFLKGVRERSEDKRWETRVDQVEMREFREAQQRFEKNLLRSAPEVSNEPDEEDMIMDDQATFEQEFLSQQEQELEAMFSALDNEQQDWYQDRPHSPTDYGSDDEQYDRLLLEMVNQTEVEAMKNSAHFGLACSPDMNMMHDSQDMDMGAG
ncbi:MAG: hypothetical protein MMC33_000951 [Icmadophila ericetorum]|nr:hypothetical protein [Icmadophila ericetorum]